MLVWGDGWVQLSVKSRMVEDLERRLETAVAAGKKAGDRVVSLEVEAAQAEKKLTKTKEKCQELTFKISNLEVRSDVDQPLLFPVSESIAEDAVAAWLSFAFPGGCRVTGGAGQVREESPP